MAGQLGGRPTGRAVRPRAPAGHAIYERATSHLDEVAALLVVIGLLGWCWGRCRARTGVALEARRRLLAQTCGTGGQAVLELTSLSMWLVLSAPAGRGQHL